MKILALTSYLSTRGGGIPAAMLRLYEILGASGLDIVIVAADAPDPMPKEIRTVLYKRLGPRSFAFSPNLLTILNRERPNIVHLHGLWTFASVAAHLWKYRTGNPLIVSPHGMVDKWALRHRALKKKIAAAIYEWNTLKCASCIHALSDGEAHSLMNLGYRGRIVKIPNGVDLGANISHINPNPNTLLYLGRLHPKKGIMEVIKAWALVGKTIGWQFVIAGWDDGVHEKRLREAVQQLNLDSEVKFVGPVFGQAKDELFARAGAVILASYSEGLPMTVLEAWAAGKPVFMTEDCNLSEAFRAGAAFKITTDPKNIADVLYDVLRSPDRVLTAGRAGRALAEASFDWVAISEQWRSVYSSLVRDGSLDEKLKWLPTLP